MGRITGGGRARSAGWEQAGWPGWKVLAPLAGLVFLFFSLPLVALVWRAATSGTFWASLARPEVGDAVRLSLVTTLLTLLLVLAAGTPVAYLLARGRLRGRDWLAVLIELPLVLPPVVAGVGLLMAFGRRGLLGGVLEILGLQVPFTTGAVVLAQSFVAAPFFIRSAMAGFAAVDRTLEEAAALDGASREQILRHVTLPLAAPGLGAGAFLAWARALSEFGATLMFAGNFVGRTQTMPLAIMSAMETDLDAAVGLAVLMLLGAVVFLSAARLLAPVARPSWGGPPG